MARNTRPPLDTNDGCLSHVGNVLARAPILLIGAIASLLYILFAGAAPLLGYCIRSEDEDEDNKSFYQKAKDLHKTAQRVAKVPHIICYLLDILLLICFTVNLFVPHLKNQLVLGSKLWKWSLLLVMVLCGYHLISMVTRLLVYFMCRSCCLRKKEKCIYFIRGMRRGVTLVLFSGSLLLTWFLYFLSSHGIEKTNKTHKILHGCTWTLVMLVVVAVLLVLKRVLLLTWEINAVYKRFRAKILVVGTNFYYLARICGWHLSIFRPKSKGEQKKCDVEMKQVNTRDNGQSSRSSDPEDLTERSEIQPEREEEKENREEQLTEAKRILCVAKDVNLYEIKKIADCLVSVSKVSARNNDGTREIILQCERIEGRGWIELKDLMIAYRLDSDEAIFLQEQLHEQFHESSSKEHGINYTDFKMFMVKAHKSCVALAHTLFDAAEVVEVLNLVMSVLVFPSSIIAWTLLTGIATAKILTCMAVPFVPATYLFGDTCKKMFDGIAFWFISHPFSIGDRCLIDDTKLEVKRINLASTTFEVVGERREAVYWHSLLSSKPLILLKNEPDLSDSLELTLNCTSTMLDELQEKVIRIFSNDGCSKYGNEVRFVVKEIGDRVKMAIHFDHVISNSHRITDDRLQQQKTLNRNLLLRQIQDAYDKIRQPRDINNL